MGPDGIKGPITLLTRAVIPWLAGPTPLALPPSGKQESNGAGYKWEEGLSVVAEEKRRKEERRELGKGSRPVGVLFAEPLIRSMAESSDSVSVDVERIAFGGSEFFCVQTLLESTAMSFVELLSLHSARMNLFHLVFPSSTFMFQILKILSFQRHLVFPEHLINTRHGVVSVSVFGDHDKPALITYPDVALNFFSLQFLLLMCHASKDYSFPLKLIPYCFTISASIISALQVMRYIDISLTFLFPFVLEMGAVPISSNVSIPSVDDLADQVAAVLNYFGLGSVMCLGVLAGAYILTLFSIKYKERVLGLIVVSPLCKAPSWTEWLCNKVLCNFLYFYGMCGLIKDCLLQRYFSKEICGFTTQFPESEIAKACRNFLDQRQSTNVWRYLHSINRRYDITNGLQQLLCRTLVFVGESSPFHCDALHMMSKLDSRFSALVEVQACGSMVTEEQPHAMMIPLEYFFMGYGLYRHNQFSDSPRSPLSPCCISPELLSLESLGVKLKPIKTRVSNEV
ncbi:hypothetical protein ZIOFF_012610 [Zingiber officinale]|uniref:Pollen-specific protein SF21 n=1 Tax=Zingiber officinale TaxID=94328 RepID=A0A8J5IA71_ZINOF|nr:hypothetical protein ZIOFF_012610 [Zingiber officinale]